MPQPHVYHVVPSAEGRWTARWADDVRSETFRSRDEALRRIREEAASHAPSQVVVHRADGSIEERFAWEEAADAPIRSKVALFGHPVHPMIIPFPVALLMLLPISDIVFWASGDPFWSRLSFYLLAAGIATAALAALVGLVDFVSIKRVRSHRDGWLHLASNVSVVALAVVNLLLRVDAWAAAIVPSGVILSVVTALLLGVGAWYGGELAFRHKVGVIDDH